MSEIDQIVSTFSIVGESEVEFYPINPLVSGDPIQFDIPESYTQFTDPGIFLKVNAKLTEADGTVLKDKARVAPVNLTLHSLFKDVILKVNGIIVNQATGCYPYRSYFETNFTYSTAAKNGAIGIPQMYQKETAGKFNGTITGVNTAFDYRVEKFAKSAEVELGGKLHCDIFMQNKLLIPGLRFSLTLIPSSTQFHILSGTETINEKLVITKIILKVRRLNLSSSAVLNVEKLLNKKAIKYPITHAVVRTAHISPGQSLVSNFVIHNGQVPRLVIVTLVQGMAFTGSNVMNPFNFTLRNCLSAQLSVNGRLFPPLPYSPKNGWIEPYLSSLRIARKYYTDSDTGLTLDDFLSNGHQILPFDLAPYEIGIPPKTNGVVTFNAQWASTSFDDTYVLLYYILWDNVISIDERKNVMLDFIP